MLVYFGLFVKNDYVITIPSQTGDKPPAANWVIYFFLGSRLAPHAKAKASRGRGNDTIMSYFLFFSLPNISLILSTAWVGV